MQTNRKKGAIYMTEKEKKILDTFGKAIPNLTESEKERLLIFGEAIGMIRDKPHDSGQEQKGA